MPFYENNLLHINAESGSRSPESLAILLQMQPFFSSVVFFFPCFLAEYLNHSYQQEPLGQCVGDKDTNALVLYM